MPRTLQRRKLGRTGLDVSEISLGTVEIGLDYGISATGQAHRPPEQEAARLLNRALDLGVNFIDTARVYGNSEELIGQALHSRRHEFILCSKVLSFSNESLEPAVLRQKVEDSLHTSLRALRTDTLDILMIHSAPLETIVRGEVLAILQDLRSQGHFRWIGASVYGEEAALTAIRGGGFDCLQVAASALDRRPERLVWPEAQRADVGIVARSVLLKGALTHRHRFLPDSVASLKHAAQELENIATQAGVSLPELAYRYVLSQPIPHTSLVGASSLDELEAGVSFAEAGPLPPEWIQRIREIDIEDERLLNPGTWGFG